MNNEWQAALLTTFWLLSTNIWGPSQAAIPKTPRFHSCLQNCANCVQFWEYGLYNGQRCAAHCLRQQGREIVDPDCNDPKMFNVSSNIIDRLMEMRQNDQQQAQLVMSDEAARPARLQVGYNDVKRKSKRRMFSRRNRQSRLKESTLERRRNEGTGDIADDENRNVHERFQVEVKAERLKGGKQRLNRHHSRNVQSTPLKSLLSSERRHPRIRQQSNRNLTKQRRKHCPKSRIRRRQS